MLATIGAIASQGEIKELDIYNPLLGIRNSIDYYTNIDDLTFEENRFKLSGGTIRTKDIFSYKGWNYLNFDWASGWSRERFFRVNIKIYTKTFSTSARENNSSVIHSKFSLSEVQSVERPFELRNDKFGTSIYVHRVWLSQE